MPALTRNRMPSGEPDYLLWPNNPLVPSRLRTRGGRPVRLAWLCWLSPLFMRGIINVRHLRPVPFLLVAALVATSLLGPPTPVAAAAQPSAPAALNWLEGELDDNAGTLPSSFGGTDWGLTSDAILALRLGGRGTEPAATTATAALAANINGYITGEAFGDIGSAYAGAIGKSMLAASLQGANVNSFGGVDLEAKSRAAIQASGMFAGRFSDVSSFGDFSNGFGQAFNVLALSRTPGGVPASAVEFLLQQQCPGGGFRLSYTATRGCESDAQASVDTTGLALQALTTLPAGNARTEAINRAAAWLVAGQDAVTGGFGTGPGIEANANSTGLAGHGLNSVGQTAAVSQAAQFVASLQFDVADTSGTPAAGEEGAIATNPGAFDGARSTGIAPAGRDQWRRATVQAVLALLPAYTLAVGPLTSVQPARVLDSRPGTFTVDGLQVGTGRVQPGTPLVVQVAGRGGVPVGADAVVLNLTADGAEGAGFVTAYPCDGPVPEASSLNFVPGPPVPNAVVMKLSAAGTMCLSVSQAAAYLIADVNGYSG